jgi:post-segregation antitoxin (ccd killing protein)
MRALLLAAGAVALLASASRDAYILSGPESRISFSTGAEIPQIRAMQARFGGDFLWVRRHGNAYVVRDTALVQRARSFFVSVSALAPAQAAVGREEAKLDHEEERLEAIADWASDSEGRTRSVKDDRSRESALRDAEAKLVEVRAKQQDVSRRERELDQREEALEREAERKLWQLVDDAIRSGAALDQR